MLKLDLAALATAVAAVAALTTALTTVAAAVAALTTALTTAAAAAVAPPSAMTVEQASDAGFVEMAHEAHSVIHVYFSTEG